jgi:hypothetical protein
MTAPLEQPLGQENAEQEKRKGKTDKKRASAAALIDAFVGQYNTDREEYNRRESHRVLREWLTIIGLFLAAGFALLQWRELSSTDRSISRQAEITDKQLAVMQGQLDVMQADQRPWVYLEQAGLVSKMTYDPKVGFSFTVALIAKNMGKTPARRVLITPIMSADSKDIYRKQNEICTEVRKSPHPANTVFPAGIMTLVFGMQIPLSSMENIPINADGTKTIIPTIFGCVDYAPTFSDKRHQTGFVLDLMFKGQWSLTFDPSVGREIPASDLSTKGSIIGEPD